MNAAAPSAVTRLATRLLGRFVRGPEFNARQWSNERLRVIGGLVHGRVLNVSGGDDSDKQGGRYRAYFPRAAEYLVSNYGALAGLPGEFAFDLETKSVPADLAGSFDVVFSHTVLEHVFAVETAVANICTLSRDAVVSVVPFLQSFHADSWYGDFWRFSPTAMVKLFERQGFGTVLVEWNEDPLGNIYVVHVAARDPARWQAVAQLERLRAHGPGVARSATLFGAAGLDKARIKVR